LTFQSIILILVLTVPATFVGNKILELHNGFTISKFLGYSIMAGVLFFVGIVSQSFIIRVINLFIHSVLVYIIVAPLMEKVIDRYLNREKNKEKIEEK